METNGAEFVTRNEELNAQRERKPLKTPPPHRDMMKGNEKDCICANNGKHTKNCDAYRLSQLSGQAAAIALNQPDSPEEKGGCPYGCCHWKKPEEKCCEEYEIGARHFKTGPDVTWEPEEEKQRYMDLPEIDDTAHHVKVGNLHELGEEKKCERIGGCLGIGCPHSSELKPVSHEKDFIEEALQEYRKTFVRRKIGHFPFDSSLVFNDVETFFKEKLTEAMEYERNTPMTIEQYQYVHKICEERRDKMREVHEQQLQEEFRQGRLAMKEEVEKLAESLKPILWSEDIYQHNRNLGAYNKLNDFLATIRDMK